VRSKSSPILPNSRYILGFGTSHQECFNFKLNDLCNKQNMNRLDCRWKRILNQGHILRYDSGYLKRCRRTGSPWSKRFTEDMLQVVLTTEWLSETILYTFPCAPVSQWQFPKYIPASNNRWRLGFIQSRVKRVVPTSVPCNIQHYFFSWFLSIDTSRWWILVDMKLND